MIVRRIEITINKSISIACWFRYALRNYLQGYSTNDYEII